MVLPVAQAALSAHTNALGVGHPWMKDSGTAVGEALYALWSP